MIACQNIPNWDNLVSQARDLLNFPGQGTKLFVDLIHIRDYVPIQNDQEIVYLFNFRFQFIHSSCQVREIRDCPPYDKDAPPQL